MTYAADRNSERLEIAQAIVLGEEIVGNRVGDSFTDLDLALFPDVGHFPHREDPDRAAAEIAGFFGRIVWR